MKMRIYLAIIAAASLVIIGCTSTRSEPQPGTINVRTGLFGPNINIGGADGDDSTPVSVRID